MQGYHSVDTVFRLCMIGLVELDFRFVEFLDLPVLCRIVPRLLLAASWV
jgi:hypothetical protein